MNTATFFRKALTAGAVAVVGLGFSIGARADTTNGIVDIWTVKVDTTFLAGSISPSGVNWISDKELRWGDSTGYGQSGLKITDSPSTQQVTTNGPAVGNVKITHFNQPITGTSLSQATIQSILTLTPYDPSGTAMAPATIQFNIHFAETTNSGEGNGRCADGGQNYQGVNINGCADIFVTDQTSLNFPFWYDLDGAGSLPNQPYYISFFELTQGLNPLSTQACAAAGAADPCLGFETREQQDTTVQFAALITTTPVVIPEPGSLLLAGLALGGLGLMRRRSRR